jgi:hypothetical protein
MNGNSVHANSFVVSKEPVKVWQLENSVSFMLGDVTHFFQKSHWTLDEVIDLVGTLYDDLCGLVMEAQVKGS